MIVLGSKFQSTGVRASMIICAILGTRVLHRMIVVQEALEARVYEGRQVAGQKETRHVKTLCIPLHRS